MTNASAPLWFYCRQTGYVIDLEAKNSALNAPYCSHCEAGMVFAINIRKNHLGNVAQYCQCREDSSVVCAQNYSMS